MATPGSSFTSTPLGHEDNLGVRKKEGSIESQNMILDFHDQDVSDEINRSDSCTTLAASPPGKYKDHDNLTMVFCSDPGV
ncbi:hypothetical protein TNCV_612711 [Trichonephila clavipes]|nr:hypothetical protein TNCV_612711 [Trichonephila clavipes]